MGAGSWCFNRWKGGGACCCRIMWQFGLYSQLTVCVECKEDIVVTPVVGFPFG